MEQVKHAWQGIPTNHPPRLGRRRSISNNPDFSLSFLIPAHFLKSLLRESVETSVPSLACTIGAIMVPSGGGNERACEELVGVEGGVRFITFYLECLGMDLPWGWKRGRGADFVLQRVASLAMASWLIWGLKGVASVGFTWQLFTLGAEQLLGFCYKSCSCLDLLGRLLGFVLNNFCICGFCNAVAWFC